MDLTKNISSVIDENSKRRKKYSNILLRDIDQVVKVGEGTFGQVYKAEYTDENGQQKQIAVKKFRYFDNAQCGISITTLREIRYLQMLDHPNLVKLLNIVHSRPSKSLTNKEMGSLYLIFEFVNNDLQGLMNNREVRFSLPDMKCLMRQIFLGMKYLHDQNIIHRDVKGANILVSNEGEIKIADFGLARHIIPQDKKMMYTQKVVTLWFRSPELLYGQRNYTAAVDCWSLGCVFAEMLLNQKRALFNGDKEDRQIQLIYELCGSPNEDSWEGVSKLRFWNEFGPKKIYVRKLKLHLMESAKDLAGHGQDLENAVDLIDQLLELNPNKRCTVNQALDHKFFSEGAPESDPGSIVKMTNAENHEFVIRAQNQKRKMSEYKKYYTFKHNMLQDMMPEGIHREFKRQGPDRQQVYWKNPKPSHSLQHVSDAEFDKFTAGIIGRIKQQKQRKLEEKLKEEEEKKEIEQRERASNQQNKYDRRYYSATDEEYKRYDYPRDFKHQDDKYDRSRKSGNDQDNSYRRDRYDSGDYGDHQRLSYGDRYGGEYVSRRRDDNPKYVDAGGNRYRDNYGRDARVSGRGSGGRQSYRQYPERAGQYQEHPDRPSRRAEGYASRDHHTYKDSYHENYARGEDPAHYYKNRAYGRNQYESRNRKSRSRTPPHQRPSYKAEQDQGYRGRDYDNRRSYRERQDEQRLYSQQHYRQSYNEDYREGDSGPRRSRDRLDCNRKSDSKQIDQNQGPRTARNSSQKNEDLRRSSRQQSNHQSAQDKEMNDQIEEEESGQISVRKSNEPRDRNDRHHEQIESRHNVRTNFNEERGQQENQKQEQVCDDKMEEQLNQEFERRKCSESGRITTARNVVMEDKQMREDVAGKIESKMNSERRSKSPEDNQQGKRNLDQTENQHREEGGRYSRRVQSKSRESAGNRSSNNRERKNSHHNDRRSQSVENHSRQIVRASKKLEASPRESKEIHSREQSPFRERKLNNQQRSPSIERERRNQVNQWQSRNRALDGDSEDQHSQRIEGRQKRFGKPFRTQNPKSSSSQGYDPAVDYESQNSRQKYQKTSRENNQGQSNIHKASNSREKISKMNKCDKTGGFVSKVNKPYDGYQELNQRHGMQSSRQNQDTSQWQNFQDNENDHYASRSRDHGRQSFHQNSNNYYRNNRNNTNKPYQAHSFHNQHQHHLDHRYNYADNSQNQIEARRGGYQGGMHQGSHQRRDGPSRQYDHYNQRGSGYQQGRSQDYDNNYSTSGWQNSHKDPPHHPGHQSGYGSSFPGRGGYQSSRQSRGGPSNNSGSYRGPGYAGGQRSLGYASRNAEQNITQSQNQAHLGGAQWSRFKAQNRDQNGENK